MPYHALSRPGAVRAYPHNLGCMPWSDWSGVPQLLRRRPAVEVPSQFAQRAAGDCHGRGGVIAWLTVGKPGRPLRRSARPSTSSRSSWMPGAGRRAAARRVGLGRQRPGVLPRGRDAVPARLRVPPFPAAGAGCRGPVIKLHEGGRHTAASLADEADVEPGDPAEDPRPRNRGDDIALHARPGRAASCRGGASRRARAERREAMTARRDPILIPSGRFRVLSGIVAQDYRNSITAGQRRRTGIEPADDAERRPPVLKTGAASLLASLAVVPNPVLAGQAAQASLPVIARHHRSPDDVPPLFPQHDKDAIRRLSDPPDAANRGARNSAVCRSSGRESLPERRSLAPYPER